MSYTSTKKDIRGPIAPAQLLAEPGQITFYECDTLHARRRLITHLKVTEKRADKGVRVVTLGIDGIDSRKGHIRYILRAETECTPSL